MALLLLLTPVVPVVATAAAPAEQRVEAVRVLMEEGQAVFAEGHAAEAARIFERGFERYPFSAFLFNAGVCHEKAGERDAALRAFERYLEVDPKAPDADGVRQRIERLKSAPAASAKGESPATGGGATAESAADKSEDMKSLVVVQTDPKGTSVTLLRRMVPDAPPPVPGKPDPAWQKMSEGPAPLAASLDEGNYRVVVAPVPGYNGSNTELVVKGGRVHDVRISLAQGQFMGHLKVMTPVEGATIYLDDPKAEHAPWGVSPHSELVPAGTHTVSIVAPGFKPFTRELEIGTGDNALLEAPLQRIDEGRVLIDSRNLGYELWIDGKLYKSWAPGTPLLSVQLPAGEHRLELRAEDHKTWSGPVSVPKGQVLPLAVALAPRYPRGTAWVQGSIAAVILGGGVYCGLRSNGYYDDLRADQRHGVLAQDDSRLTKGKWFAAGADAGFAIGGIMAALATYNFLRDPYPESSATSRPPREFGAGTGGAAPSRQDAADSTPEQGGESSSVGAGARGAESAGLGVATWGGAWGLTWGGSF